MVIGPKHWRISVVSEIFWQFWDWSSQRVHLKLNLEVQWTHVWMAAVYQLGDLRSLSHSVTWLITKCFTSLQGFSPWYKFVTIVLPFRFVSIFPDYITILWQTESFFIGWLHIFAASGENPTDRLSSSRKKALRKRLVGGFSPPLWKIWKSIGMMTFPIYGKIKNVPNHQPEDVSDGIRLKPLFSTPSRAFFGSESSLPCRHVLPKPEGGHHRIAETREAKGKGKDHRLGRVQKINGIFQRWFGMLDSWWIWAYAMFIHMYMYMYM